MGAILGFFGPRDDALLARMSRTLTHRGNAVQQFADLTASLECRSHLDEADRCRLGIGCHQDGKFAIALAGYITNAAELELPSGCMLSALLGLYRSAGPEFVARLRGAFALAISDGKQLMLARDGSGQRTLYYGQHQGRLLFASEPKGVVSAPGFPRRIRPAAMAQYLSFSFVPGEGTMLEDLYELPAGHLLLYDERAGVRLRRYFHFEDNTGPDAFGDPNETLTDDAWVERFRQEFRRAVEERRPRGEPVAVFLSGGLDSSIVTAELAALHDRPVKTYALHFGTSYPHELDFARAVAERCGTEHREVLIQPRDFLPRLRQMIWHLDDPIGDPITQPNYELASVVAQDVRWAYNGEGGDPCYGGPKNVPMMLHHWYGGIDRSGNFRERMYLASYRRGYEELSRLLSPDIQRQIDPETDLEGVLKPYFDAVRPQRFLDKLAAINIRLKGAHLILPKVERMAGAWGLETLAPLFDERIVRLSFALPGTLKLAAGVEKIVLKRAFADRLPASVIDRPKSGMRVPVHYWFQDELRRYARKILSPRAVRRVGLFDPARVKQLLDYNVEEGPGRYGLRLWMLLTFEIWRRLVIDGETP